MSGQDGLPPQVVRRGDEYVILNVELEPLNHAQRAALAAEVWEQAEALLRVNGEEIRPKLVDQRLGEMVGIGRSGVELARRISIRKPEVLPRLHAGEITISDAQREAGFILKVKLDEGAPSHAKFEHAFYGKGDKFKPAIEPLRRYLRSWRKRDFEFRHVNPAEAKRRLRLIDETIALLQQSREDLVKRSHVATLSAPSEKRKGKRK